MIKKSIKYFIKRIQWFFQKIFRGYSDCDLWGLNTHLSELILKRLKAFKKMDKMGMPASIPEEFKCDTDKASKIYEGFLDDMIWSFEYIVKDYMLDEAFDTQNGFDQKTYEKNYLKYKYGMEIFAKYFESLWD